MIAGMAGFAVIIHNQAQAEAALAAAEALGVPIRLDSPPGAAATLGPLVFLAMIEAAAKRHPGASFEAVFDCADRPGQVLAAWRAGLRRVRYRGSPASRRKLLAIAESLGTTLLTGRSDALDLANQTDPERALREGLSRR
jgi:hypothetical protein